MLPYAEGSSLSFCRTIKYSFLCLVFITVFFFDGTLSTAATRGHEPMGHDSKIGGRDVQDRSP